MVVAIEAWLKGSKTRAESHNNKNSYPAGFEVLTDSEMWPMFVSVWFADEEVLR